jgi:prolyl-tRNA editing enzyme YbaK/EbsC (Cys-tRNA(Pro) deacylase)
MRASEEEKLRQYIEEHNIEAEHLQFDVSCHSVAEAAKAANARPTDFVKNICMVADDGQLIVAIVKGEDMASRSRVGKILGIPRPRLALPDEILELTGYLFGGTPSFGIDATYLVDERVMEMAVVLTGGGSDMALMRVSPEEMLRANGGRVVRVRR